MEKKCPTCGYIIKDEIILKCPRCSQSLMELYKCSGMCKKCNMSKKCKTKPK